MKRLNTALLAVAFGAMAFSASASSHREAPLISNDPLADNTDVYAFRSPVDTNNVVLMANYIPAELAHGGPNWYSFGTGIRYEIHVKNDASTMGDDVTYRFTFQKTNEDTTTFFNIRLGLRNQKNTYTLERSIKGGAFTTIITNGIVPPANIGPRSIEGAAGMNRPYDSLVSDAVVIASTGEKVFAGPRDDPFFVDLGGAFDLGGFRQPGRDGLAKYNVHSLVIEVPITTLQKTNRPVTSATSILDGDFVIGVWASASRQQVRTLSTTGAEPVNTGNYVQVSRLGMPLTNEVVVAIGQKDLFNAASPANDYTNFRAFFEQPELALYIDSTFFATAVPGLADLRIQKASRRDIIPTGFNFGNGGQGLFVLKGSPLLNGTALAPGPSAGGAGFGDILLPNATSPRAVDILPIFLTGVPNLPPYQLATGKSNFNFGSGPALNPLSAGKPFLNNFLPTLGDMLRLNMAVPVTPRNSADFSSLGIVQAAVLGLTNTTYNGSAALQFIPNMDGFPNGRRLEDDVTTIELQAVSGVALAAIGMFYDDYNAAPQSPITARLLSVVGFNAGVTQNDTTLRTTFPYAQTPWRGFNGASYSAPPPAGVGQLNLAAPDATLAAYPNPFVGKVNFRYRLNRNADVTIVVADINGRTVQVLHPGKQVAGDYVLPWTNSGLAAGSYFARLSIGGQVMNTVKLVKTQ